MNIMGRGGEARMHGEMAALIPWYVNGSIGDSDRQRMDAHLAQCARCQEDLILERRVYEGMSVESGVEYMPAASLKRLQAKLDGASAAAPDTSATALPATALPVRAWRRAVTWQGVMAASVAIMAVAVSLLAIDRWTQSRSHAAALYSTVTTSQPRVSNEVIRAVFTPTITLIELQGVLDAAGLRIVSGPSEAGVYSLARNSERPVSASLAAMRGDAIVRFAESIQPSVGVGDTP